MSRRERKRKEDGWSNLWEKIWRLGVELDANVNPPSHRSSPRELVRAPEWSRRGKKRDRSLPRTLMPTRFALRISRTKMRGGTIEIVES